MKRRVFLKNTGAISLATLITPVGIFQSKHTIAPEADLEKNFKLPPSSARPHTWWHWMNGNVTKEGITLDLEAMARVGVGGFQNFDAGTGIPKGPVQYLSPEWLELKKHAIREAERLGLEFTMHNCPGWSSSGGPWITPERAMQEVTWSEIFVEGGKQLAIQLPKPLTRLNYYKDIVTLACPSLQGEVSIHKIAKSVTTNRGSVDLRDTTGENTDGITLEPLSSGVQSPSAFILYEFNVPYEAQSITFLTSASVQQAGPIKLDASDDGKLFREVLSINLGGGFGGGPQGEVFVAQDFTPVTARYFRLSCAAARHFSQLRFSNTRRADEWQKRSNYSFNRSGAKELTGSDTIAANSILDITQHVNQDGLLTWNAPKGNWTILRFGFTPLGTLNRSAPDTGIGLECDKYSSEAMEFHFNKMMENLLPALKSISGNGKVGLLIDSYEVGMQNWTPGFEAEFKKRNGYDLLKYLPAFTGRIVENADITNRFLWDVRRTQGDLMADNYYGKFTELCHQNNIISYCQPYDRGPMEEMQIGSRIDINVGEFWNNLSSIFQNNWTMRRTVKLSAAIAHTNGQKVVAAESFTGEPESARWQEYPFGMKALGDKMFAQGLNRIVFHRFAHQPHPTARPGMTMGPWGIHFDRTNTWWEPAKAYHQYLGRCQYLLQWGNFVADLVYFTGEDAGVYTKVLPTELTPQPPAGFDYDLVNAEVLLKKAKVVNGQLMLPDGMRYNLLVLQDQKNMSLELIRKVRELVSDGLIIVGTKPEKTTGLRNMADGEIEFQKLTNELWGTFDTNKVTDNSIGKGRVLWGQPIGTILEAKGIKGDFEVTSRSGDAPVTYIHRKDGDTDIYFIANQRRTTEDLVCTFRVSDRQPEFWDAVTGTTTLVSIYQEENGRIIVPLQLQPCGSMFVVFRKRPAAKPFTDLTKGSPIFSTTRFSGVDRTTYNDVTNNFTISFWAKPENFIMTGTRNFMDGQDPWTDYYAIYPPSGKELYGTGNTTCGLTVGRNGVAVWEHGDRKPVFVFAATVPISGWSHIALVYSDGIPAVYVNGAFTQRGEKSSDIVHPGVGQAYLSEGASYYNGDMTKPVVQAEVLNEARIRELASYKPEFSYKTSESVEQTGSIRSGLLFFENGNFNVTDVSGKTSSIKIEGLESIDLTSSWKVSFPERSGAPLQLDLPRLVSLHRHADAGVKYFSGTATYRKTFSVPASMRKNKRTYLDLGQVEIMSEIILNGTNLGIQWSRPYRIDVSDALKAGENTVEIKVTNLWPNRLIGDEQFAEPYQYTPGAGGSGFASLSGGAILELPDWYQRGQPKPDDGRVTFATWKHYHKNSPLLESGLVGPVFLYSAILKEI